MVEQAKFAYSRLEKTLENQTEKQVGDLESLNLSNKEDELRQIDCIFQQNLMNDLIVFS